MLSKRIPRYRQGECRPWGYAMAYYDMWRDEMVLYPIPLHRIVSAARVVYHWLLCHSESRVDKLTRDITAKVYAEAWKQQAEREADYERRVKEEAKFNIEQGMRAMKAEIENQKEDPMPNVLTPRVVREIEYQDEDDRPRYIVHWRTVGLDHDVCGRVPFGALLWKVDRETAEKILRFEVARMIERLLREMNALPDGDTVVVETIEEVEE